MSDDFSLNSRLRNCLATVLELETALSHTHMGGVLAQEFHSLKKVMENIELVDVCEDDVQRIEAATGKFLSELTDTLAEVSAAAGHKRVLQ